MEHKTRIVKYINIVKYIFNYTINVYMNKNGHNGKLKKLENTFKNVIYCILFLN